MNFKLAWSNVWHSLCAPLFSWYSPLPLHKAAYSEMNEEKTPTLYYCGSISHSQCHQAATEGLPNKLEDKTGAEDDHSPGSSALLTRGQSCCTWTHQGLGYFNTGAVSSSRQGTGMNQVQDPSSESRQEMRPEVRLKTRMQQGQSTGQNNS